MPINSSPLNTTPLNSPQSGIPLSITDYIIISLSEVVPAASLPVISSINISTTDLLDHIRNNIQKDILSISDTSSSKAVFSNILINYISVLDVIRVIYNNSVSSQFSLDSQVLKYLSVNTVVVDTVISTDTTINNTILKNVLVSTISIIDTLEKGLYAEAIDSIGLSDTLDLLYKLVETVIDSLFITEETKDYSSYLFLISEDINAISNSTSLLESFNLLEDIFIVRIGGETNSTYVSYAFSPETNSLSTYNNYNFKLSTKFNNKYLFANDTGLYEYGGLTDNGDAITSEIATVAFNFNSSNLKQVPSLYLGVDSTDNFILKVRIDGKAEVLYRLNKYTNNLMTQKVDIGKGLIGRYFQFELITEASEFNLESIEFMPLEIRRKI